MIEIKEAYRDYQPPIDISSSIKQLITYIPEKYLFGLKYISLINSENFSRQDRRKKTWSRDRQVKVQDCRGLYHEQWHGKPAWIEIHVNNILESVPHFVLRIPLLRDLLISAVLYHVVQYQDRFPLFSCNRMNNAGPVP